MHLTIITSHAVFGHGIARINLTAAGSSSIIEQRCDGGASFGQQVILTVIEMFSS